MQPQPEHRTPPPAGGNDLLQHAKQTTSEVASEVKGLVQEQAGSKIDQTKAAAADELQRVAGAVRQFGDQLGSQQGQGPIGQYAAEYGRKAADGLERLTNYLRQHDTKQLVSDIGNLGRRQPALLIGGAFLLGLAGARFLKSSMPAMRSNMNMDRGLTPPSTHQPAHVSTTSATL